MLMTFSFRENVDSYEPTNSLEIDSVSTVHSKLKDEKIHIFAEKLRAPHFEEYIPRPRLDELLSKSLNQIGAALITGRAGTGKTSLAAHFARNYDKTVWFRVEAADNDWKFFSSYLSAAVKTENSSENKTDVSLFIENLFSEMEKIKLEKPRLIVLDDIHNVFDADWFNDFFQTALYSLTPETHLIFLSRSKPAFPLWRLRSKQVLSVIDEKILAFDRGEAEIFCGKLGLSAKQTAKIYKESYGRIGKLKVLAEAV